VELQGNAGEEGHV